MRLGFGTGDASRPHDKPSFRIGHFPVADHDDTLAPDPVEEGERMHQPSSQSGTRSASMIESAPIRSATTA